MAEKLNGLPLWLKTFLASLAGAVGGALVDAVPTIIRGNTIDWIGVKNAAIVGSFMFLIGYLKQAPSQLAKQGQGKLEGP